MKSLDIGGDLPETGECRAHRGLTETYALPGSADVAFTKQRVQHDEQVQIDVTKSRGAEAEVGSFTKRWRGLDCFPVRGCAVSRGFRQGLRDLGYVEGERITIEARFAEGQAAGPSRRPCAP